MVGQTFLLGDAEERLRGLADESVQLVVTSPPYWCIKDYDHPRQIGHQDTYERYLDRLEAVWAQCGRVLAGGCKLAINVGDQFLRAKDHGQYRVVPIHADVTAQVLCLGDFSYLGGIIWRKITTTKTTGGGCWMGSVYYPRDGYVTYEHEFILLFKKRGRSPRPTKGAKERSQLTKEQRSLWFRGVWDDVPPAKQVGHQAMFPVALPERLIRMFSFWGETVLDPFVGSGTTLVAAESAGRRGVGIDVDPRCLEVARARVPGLISRDLTTSEKTGA